MKAKQVFFILVSTFSIILSASAELIRIEVTGHVTQTPFGSYDDILGQYPLISIGDPMTGYCIYDADNPDMDGSSSTGEYLLDSITMQIGTYTFTNGAHTVDDPVFRVWTFDEFYRAICPSDIDIYVNSVLTTWSGQMTLLEIGNATHGRADDTFPLSFPDDLATYFPASNFQVAGNFINIVGEIDSAQVIPEPATMIFLAAGALVLKRKK